MVMYNIKKTIIMIPINKTKVDLFQINMSSDQNVEMFNKLHKTYGFLDIICLTQWDDQ